jgi:hypothetical protein
VKKYLTRKQRRDIREEWSRLPLEQQVPYTEFLACKVADIVIEECAQVCDRNGLSDGHTCAKELRGLT